MVLRYCKDIPVNPTDVYNPQWVPQHLVMKIFQKAAVLKESSAADQILHIFKLFLAMCDIWS